MDGTANTDSGDRPSQSALRVSKDPGAAEPGGLGVGKTLVQRLYQEEGLVLKQRPKRSRRVAEHPRERVRATETNQAWSLDFVSDQLTGGRRFRALTIVDVFTRESLAIEVGQALKGTDVVEVLNRLRFKRSVAEDISL
jgi:putative transposase